MSIDQATEALARACERAGVEIRTLHDLSELDDARRIFDQAWPAESGGTQLQPNLLKAMMHAGGYCSAAYADGRPVGAAMGFIGRHYDHGWQAHLHSHMAAVAAASRDRHIGTALKYHQRVWARSHEIPVITWTFDPLVRRNARLNILKLGVEVREFEPDFYGPMDDGINSGDPTDRLFAWWVVDSERANRAARGELHAVTPAELAADPDCRVIELPRDIVELRLTRPDEALEWRLRVRAAILDAFAQGYAITGLTGDGHYVLRRGV